MHYNTRSQRVTWLGAGCLFILYLCCLNLTAGQEAQEGSKGLKPDEVGIKLSPRRKTIKPITLRTHKPFTRRPAPQGTSYAQLGVTIWRVDSGRSKGLEQVGAEQTIERLDTNAPYQNGDTIRLIIESPVRGFMYIVDQEQYADGSYGPAMLAFPTLRTRNGNNLIEAWIPVEVPAYPAVWRFKPRELKASEVRKVQVAEVLTIIVSPNAFPKVDSRIIDKQFALSKGEFERWQNQWQSPILQFDVEKSIGQTVRSKGLEQEGKEASIEDEFGAQTIYQVAIKPGNPVFVTLPLRFKTSPVSGGKG